MVKPNGSGRIVFPDGYVITVGPGVVSIAMKSPCERTGRLIETGGSLKDGPAPIAEEHRDVLPFMAVVGVAAGFILAPHKESPASP
jgi:hypothetical protein